MSHQMQVISELKAQVEELSGRIGGVEGVIEEITEDFAVRLLEAAGAITQGVKENGEQLERAGERAEAISRLLEEAFSRLSGAFEAHHRRNEATLAALSEKADRCSGAAWKIAEAAKRCEGFKRDYEETVTRARHSMSYATETMDSEVERLRNETDVIIERVEGIETGRMRRALFMSSVFVIGLLVGVLITLLIATR